MSARDHLIRAAAFAIDQILEAVPVGPDYLNGRIVMMIDCGDQTVVGADPAIPTSAIDNMCGQILAGDDEPMRKVIDTALLAARMPEVAAMKSAHCMVLVHDDDGVAMIAGSVRIDAPESLRATAKILEDRMIAERDRLPHGAN